MESIKIEQQKESKVKALKSKMSDRRKSKKEEQEDTVSRFNRVSKPTNFILNIIFALISAACIIPFIFVLIISFTSEDYIKTKEIAFKQYEDRENWAKKMLINISKAGYFSSDRTIQDYNDDIWKLN